MVFLHVLSRDGTDRGRGGKLPTLKIYHRSIQVDARVREHDMVFLMPFSYVHGGKLPTLKIYHRSIQVDARVREHDMNFIDVIPAGSWREASHTEDLSSIDPNRCPRSRA